VSRVSELIIVGGGPAGIVAGIYAGRGGVRTLLIEKEILGGVGRTISKVENYPGFPVGISGMELMNRMVEQVRKVGIEVKEFEEVKGVEKRGEMFVVWSNKGEYLALNVIAATGMNYKRLNVPGEEKLIGKGVSFCATCDGPLFKNKKVAVIGCGESGLQEGEFLLRFATEVVFVERLPYVTGGEKRYKRLKKTGKTKFWLGWEVKEILGKERVEEIVVKKGKVEEKIEVEGVFVYIGGKPNTQWVNGMVKLDVHGFISTDNHMESSVRNFFAIGDVREGSVHQIVTACSEGVVAVKRVISYLNDRYK